jgi:hypothetical protein
MALGASFAGGSVASAGTSVVDFTSNTNVKGLGHFSGTATLDSSTDLLTIVMNNTSSKGYLYGLAFDLEGGEKGKDLTVDKHGFKGVGKQGIRVKPYGKYQAGAVDTGSNRHAIVAGASKTFVFRITGAPLNLTAFDLLDNPKGESMVAEFRGFRHGKTDHAAATVVIPAVAPALIIAPTGASDPVPVTGGTIVATTTPTTTGPTGSKPTGGGTITLPGGGGSQTPMAVPLPSAALSGMTMLALLGGVVAKRKLAGMIA